MTRLQKAKQWTKDHSQALIIGTCAVGGTALIVLGLKADAKLTAKRKAEHDEWVGEINTWVQNQKDQGHSVFPLHNGDLLAVPDETIVTVAKQK